MNKTELIGRLSFRMDIPKEECLLIVNTCLDFMSDELKKGNSILLKGFGSFNIWEQTERPGRNPRTGISCPIRPRNSVKFKPGKNLLEKLNKKEQGKR